MRNLQSYLIQIHPISPTDWQVFTDIAQPRSLKKETLIIRENERFDQEIFIEKGVVRAFIIDEEGNEKSTAFFQEGEFMSTTAFRNKAGFSLYNYQTLCESQLVFFDSLTLKAYFSKHKDLIQLGKQLKEKEIARISSRDKCLLQVKAKDKYLEFLKCYPEIERYISQKYIASYLGITPVSLSRIKSNI